MTTTYDVTTDIGKLRLMIGDNDIVPVTDAHFTDEELQVYLTLAGSDLFLAAAYSLKAWAASIAGVADSERIGDYSYSNKTVANKLAVAENYLKMSAQSPASDWAEMDLVDYGEAED